MSIQLRKSKLPTIPGSEATGESKEETLEGKCLRGTEKGLCTEHVPTNTHAGTLAHQSAAELPESAVCLCELCRAVLREQR